MGKEAISDHRIDLTAEQATFARLARVAKALFGAAFADVVLLRRGFVWRSSSGAERDDDPAPLVTEFMRSGELMWVEDARLHPTMSKDPLVTGEPHVRFYAGAPIFTADGEAIGGLTIIDLSTHPYDARLAERLKDLATVVGCACDQARERAELAKTQRRLTIALEIADVHVWELDFVRQTLEKMGAEDTFLERPATFDDLARDSLGIVHPDDRARVFKAAGPTLDGLQQPLEFRVNRSDGKEVWASSVIQLERDADQTLVGIVGAMQNITHRKQTEAMLVEAKNQAESASRAKSEFLANMSHELRTPLNGVMGVASVLAGTRLTRAQRNMVQLVCNSARSLEALLSDILDLTRIDAGRMEIRPAPFDLAASLQACADLYAPCAEAKGLDLRVEIDPAARGRFVGDAMRIRQVVSNLLSNAVKFTNAGAVALSVRTQASDEGAEVRFEVSDTGVGFSDADKARLFERFEQADGSLTRPFSGAGVGLSICRSLVGAMGGRLTAVSAPGKGSTFAFALKMPRAQQAPAAQAAAGVGSAPAASLKVLCAEDNPTNQQVVRLILEAAGIGVVCVGNGALALDAWAAGGFDMVLMDMQMPVMDGLTAIREIRGREHRQRLQRTPIYTLTANALPEDAQAAWAAGADGHLTKPITARMLLDAVASAVAPEGALAAQA